MPGKDTMDKLLANKMCDDVAFLVFVSFLLSSLSPPSFILNKVNKKYKEMQGEL